MKYIQITRSDTDGSYIMPVKDLYSIIPAELDDIDYLNGVSIILTVIELSEEEYNELGEFQGW
jgi:hypothetical protein